MPPPPPIGKRQFRTVSESSRRSMVRSERGGSDGAKHALASTKASPKKSSLDPYRKIHDQYGVVLEEYARKLAVDVDLLGAVVKVEAGGRAFSEVQGQQRPIIRFENHHFYKHFTNEGKDKAKVKVFNEHFKFKPGDTWHGHEWRDGNSASWVECHKDQEGEYAEFEYAKKLDADAAFKSISVGMGQIMGSNAKLTGYASAKEMYDAFAKDDLTQIGGMMNFIENTRSGKALKALRRRDLLTFATCYNGGGNAAEYSSLLKSASEAYKQVENEPVPFIVPPRAVIRLANQPAAKLGQIGFDDPTQRDEHDHLLAELESRRALLPKTLVLTPFKLSSDDVGDALPDSPVHLSRNVQSVQSAIGNGSGHVDGVTNLVDQHDPRLTKGAHHLRTASTVMGIVSMALSLGGKALKVFYGVGKAVPIAGTITGVLGIASFATKVADGTVNNPLPEQNVIGLSKELGSLGNWIERHEKWIQWATVASNYLSLTSSVLTLAASILTLTGVGLPVAGALGTTAVVLSGISFALNPVALFSLFVKSRRVLHKAKELIVAGAKKALQAGAAAVEFGKEKLGQFGGFLKRVGHATVDKVKAVGSAIGAAGSAAYSVGKEKVAQLGGFLAHGYHSASNLIGHSASAVGDFYRGYFSPSSTAAQTKQALKQDLAQVGEDLYEVGDFVEEGANTLGKIGDVMVIVGAPLAATVVFTEFAAPLVAIGEFLQMTSAWGYALSTALKAASGKEPPKEVAARVGETLLCVLLSKLQGGALEWIQNISTKAKLAEFAKHRPDLSKLLRKLRDALNGLKRFTPEKIQRLLRLHHTTGLGKIFYSLQAGIKVLFSVFDWLDRAFGILNNISTFVVDVAVAAGKGVVTAAKATGGFLTGLWNKGKNLATSAALATAEFANEKVIKPIGIGLATLGGSLVGGIAGAFGGGLYGALLGVKSVDEGSTLTTKVVAGLAGAGIGGLAGVVGGAALGGIGVHNLLTRQPASEEDEKTNGKDGELTGPYVKGKDLKGSESIAETAFRRGAAIYVNGINTSRDAHREAAMLLSESEGPVVGVFNKSGVHTGKVERPRLGFFHDIAQALSDKLNDLVPNPATKTLVNLLSSRRMPPGPINLRDGQIALGGVRIFAHSQGSIIVSEALRQIQKNHPDVDLKRMDVTTMGNAAYTMPEGPRYHNYAHDSDVMPTFLGTNSWLSRVMNVGPLTKMFKNADVQASTVTLHHPGELIKPHDVGDYIKELPKFRAKEAAHLPQDKMGPNPALATGSTLFALIRGFFGSNSKFAKDFDKKRNKQFGVQRKGDGPMPLTNPSGLRDWVLGQDGAGSSIPRQIHQTVTPHLGADVSHARVHTGPAAIAASREIGARAFTIGSDVFFGESNFQPTTSSGLHLLSHELAHVVQQGSGQNIRKKLEDKDSYDHFEREADSVADQVLSGSATHAGSSAVIVECRPSYQYLDGTGGATDAGRLNGIVASALDRAKAKLRKLSLGGVNLEQLSLNLQINLSNQSDEEAAESWANAIVDAALAAIPARGEMKPLSPAIQQKPDHLHVPLETQRANATGLPDNLKSGIESLSGHVMDAVKVHYQSPQPASLNAHAYANGNALHIGSGEANHMPHEAWHTVQQRQGRVLPTLQMKRVEGGVPATGLPDNLKSGIESLSGHAMDAVKVHYQSQRPASLNAHAYANGNEPHVGTGEANHLPHEAWHTVQQRQGRVHLQLKRRMRANLGVEKLDFNKDALGCGSPHQRMIQSKVSPMIQLKGGRPYWLNGVKAEPVETNPALWTLNSNDHLVGPYDEIRKHAKTQGGEYGAFPAHHIIPKQYYPNLNLKLDPETAPSVWIDPGLHTRLHQMESAMGGGNGLILKERDLMSIWPEVYREIGMPDLAMITRAILSRGSPTGKTPRKDKEFR